MTSIDNSSGTILLRLSPRCFGQSTRHTHRIAQSFSIINCNRNPLPSVQISMQNHFNLRQRCPWQTEAQCCGALSRWLAPTDFPFLQKLLIAPARQLQPRPRRQRQDAPEEVGKPLRMIFRRTSRLRLQRSEGPCNVDPHRLFEVLMMLVF